MEREMNFWDLCVACSHAVGRGLAACGRLLAHMTRLTYRYWWLVLTLVVLAVAASLYYTREENRTYKVNAVALLNGPTIPQFEQAYAPLRSGQLLPPDAAITSYLMAKTARCFDSFRVIDCLDDEMADRIDFKRKSSPTDTTEVQMQDRLCLQFRVKARHIDQVPQIEQALLAILNSNDAMQRSYAVYAANLRDEVAFNHRQALKLDSLTSVYYFNNPALSAPQSHVGNGVSFYGDRRIRLFLEEIYAQQEHMQRGDYRLQLATAPVVLENHFAVDPKPVNGRLRCLVLFLLLGWCGACLLAECIDQRKALNAWLKA